MNKMLLLMTVLLGACTTQAPQPMLILPPEMLLQSIPRPAVPDAQTATQKDVAKLLLEQQQALALCNATLSALKDWRQSWLTP